MAWVFLLTTTVIVAATGLWPDTEPAILILLAFSGLFVVVVHDLLPADTLGPAKFVVEGSVAITVATLLVALTGGVASPFFFAFPLIVGGAALVVSPPITLTLVAAAAIGYLLAVVAGSPGALGPATAAVVGVNLTALVLIAYVAMVIAREQRRTRDAAIRLSTVDSLTEPVQPDLLLRRARPRDRPQRALGAWLLPADDGSRRAQGDQRPARPLHRRPGAARRRRGHHARASARSTRPPATAATSSSSSCPRPTRPAPTSWPRRSGSASTPCRSSCRPTAPRPSLSIGVVAYPDDGRTADELIISADGAMYASKRAGKDRVTGVPMPGSEHRATPV